MSKKSKHNGEEHLDDLIELEEIQIPKSKIRFNAGEKKLEVEKQIKSSKEIKRLTKKVEELNKRSEEVDKQIQRMESQLKKHFDLKKYINTKISGIDANNTK